jgi:hypothetical protein
MCQKAQGELFADETPIEAKANPMGTTARREGGPNREVVGVASGSEKPIGLKVDEE